MTRGDATNRLSAALERVSEAVSAAKDLGEEIKFLKESSFRVAVRRISLRSEQRWTLKMKELHVCSDHK